MAKYLGLGITLEVDADDAGGGAFAVIAQVRDIAGPSAETTDVDVTSRDSTGVWNEFLGGFKNGGEVTLDLVYDPGLAGHDSIATLFISSLEIPFKMKHAGSSKMATFRGYFKAFQPQAPLEDRFSANVTIKVTKAIAFHATLA